MWLREACRHAVNAAQDSLVFMSSKYASSDTCKVCIGVFQKLRINVLREELQDTILTIYIRNLGSQGFSSNAIALCCSTTRCGTLPSMHTTWNTFI